MTRMTAFAARTSGNGEFDADWYRAAYPDVAMLGMDPAEHFRLYGALMGRAPNAALAADPARVDLPHGQAADTDDGAERAAALKLPAPRKRGELLAAHEIALTGAHARAIHYARKHLPSELAHTLHVLEANRAIVEGDEGRWLHHLNGYLGHFGVAPVALGARGEGNILSRITTQALPPVTDGPLVTVIMPAWNARTTIEYAVRSILNQTWHNLELLIVDDASEDGTSDIIQRLAAGDNRIRTFRNSVNVGPYVSKNVAVTQAKGDWITGHDTDDWAHPERIARQVEFCINNKTPVCMSGTARMAEDGSFVRLNPTGGFVFDGVCRSAFISLMIQAEFFHDLLGFWDPVRIAGDSEILRRIERLRDSSVPSLFVMTQLMLDNPEGLTNHPRLGLSEKIGRSPHRAKYKKNYLESHKSINKKTSRIKSFESDRRFPAPPEMLNPAGRIPLLASDYRSRGVAFAKSINVDVALIATLNWMGGNASSTLDEISFFSQNGLSVAVIHCPITNDMGRAISPRFHPWNDKITHWSRLEKLTAKVLICRHPAVISSHPFKEVAPRIRADSTFAVINNSYRRATGHIVYDRREMVEATRSLNTRNITYCPISPAMRREIEQYARETGTDLAVSERDWTPTFDLSLYQLPPKETMQAPYIIGRHGRDHVDKWPDDRAMMLEVFPPGSEFSISILGGAKVAQSIFGVNPGNWQVAQFGTIEPREYLKGLDVFVNFPNTGLVEGFGRTIVEAMLASRPVLVPRAFEPTFDDLPIYLEPAQVANAVRTLAQDDTSRIGYLTEVQGIATARYSSPVIARRLAGTGLNLPGADLKIPQLSDSAMQFKRRIEATPP